MSFCSFFFFCGLRNYGIANVCLYANIVYMSVVRGWVKNTEIVVNFYGDPFLSAVIIKINDLKID